MPRPTSKTELRRLLGMATYLGRFVPNMAELLQPLPSMLSSKQEFVWEAAQEDAFGKWKKLLSSSPVLAVYSNDRPTKITADASSYGLGAVLRQKQDPGKELTAADALSRSPVSHGETNELEREIEGHVGQLLSTLPVSPPSLDELKQEQHNDPDEPTQECLVPCLPDRDRLRAYEAESRKKQQHHFNIRHGARDLPDLDPDTDVWIVDLKKFGTVKEQAEEPRLAAGHRAEADTAISLKNVISVVTAVNANHPPYVT
ncbi:protein NYNRIN-like [Haemaphysalis longicornis]